jgi:hypothetical protein
MATLDHLYSRFHPHRQAGVGEEVVLACIECNAARCRRENLVFRDFVRALGQRGMPTSAWSNRQKIGAFAATLAGMEASGEYADLMNGETMAQWFLRRFPATKDDITGVRNVMAGMLQELKRLKWMFVVIVLGVVSLVAKAYITGTWEDKFSEDVGGASFLPMLIGVHNEVAYLVAHPMCCLTFNKWRRPNPPYVIFRYLDRTWGRITLQELPAELRIPNLIFSSPDREAEKTRQCIVSTDTITGRASTAFIASWGLMAHTCFCACRFPIFCTPAIAPS